MTSMHGGRTSIISIHLGNRLIGLLLCLGVRCTFTEVTESEKRLRAWTAWDESSAPSFVGCELYIQSGDLDVFGTKLVELYPAIGPITILGS